MTGLHNVVSLAAGGEDTCAVLKTGSVQCWGDNSSGQLGDGTTNTRTSPVRVSGISNAISVATGRVFSCAVLRSGSIKCWGDNGTGALGDGSADGPSTCQDADPCSLTPMTVAGINNATAVSAGNARRAPCFAPGRSNAGATRRMEP